MPNHPNHRFDQQTTSRAWELKRFLARRLATTTDAIPWNECFSLASKTADLKTPELTTSIERRVWALTNRKTNKLYNLPLEDTFEHCRYNPGPDQEWREYQLVEVGDMKLFGYSKAFTLFTHTMVAVICLALGMLLTTLFVEPVPSAFNVPTKTRPTKNYNLTVETAKDRSLPFQCSTVTISCYGATTTNYANQTTAKTHDYRWSFANTTMAWYHNDNR